MQSAGVPTSIEPNCSRVAGSNPVTSAGDRADVLGVLQDRLLLSDVSVTPVSYTHLTLPTILLV